MNNPIVTLTTDFGTSDGYVGAMKGVILSIHARVNVVDITHEIPPQDIMCGAMAIETASAFFPEHAVHVAVVDPGVGSERKPIGIRTESGIFVGPDNGLFTLAVRACDSVEIFQLREKRFFLNEVSSTFHGRDVFAPVGAHLAMGAPLEEMGSPLKSMVYLDIPEPAVREGCIRGSIIHIDRFGNLITNISGMHLEKAHLREPFQVHWGEHTLEGLKTSYSSAPPGSLAALFGSSGRLEISRNSGRADVMGDPSLEVRISRC
ncbi:MAG: SAM-dependent chlorinase/fluorinase [Deltaproteobacteria bacterium]|nr:SAM-dependent chlorinase/fluorinase [Deltaproteobacteria bacterium]